MTIVPLWALSDEAGKDIHTFQQEQSVSNIIFTMGCLRFIGLSATGSACLRITKVVKSLAVDDGSSSKSRLKIIEVYRPVRIFHFLGQQELFISWFLINDN